MNTATNNKSSDVQVGTRWQSWALPHENYTLVVEKVQGDKVDIKYDEDQLTIVFAHEYGKDSDEYKEMMLSLKEPRSEFIYETLSAVHLLQYYDKL